MVDSLKKDTRRAGRVIAQGFSTQKRQWAGGLLPLPAPPVTQAQPWCPCTLSGAIPLSPVGLESRSYHDMTCSSINGCEAEDAVACCRTLACSWPNWAFPVRAERELEAQRGRDWGDSLVCKGPGDFCYEKIQKDSPWTVFPFHFDQATGKEQAIA